MQTIDEVKRHCRVVGEGIAMAVGTAIVRKSLVVAVVALTAFFAAAADHLDLGTPGRQDQILKREGYALGYSRKHMLALWVQYRLTKGNVLTRNSIRTNDFRSDPELPTNGVKARDFSKSGYDKGHLAPAEDMKYSEKAMIESFYMSNMCPQISGFNRGVWKKLEAAVRRFAYNEGSVVVVTGPVFPLIGGRKLGDKITVPSKFYKVVYSEGKNPKMIAFLLPHQSRCGELSNFVCTVAKVEAETGLKFFIRLPEDVQKELKTKSSPEDWGLTKGK